MKRLRAGGLSLFGEYQSSAMTGFNVLRILLQRLAMVGYCLDGILLEMSSDHQTKLVV